MEVVVMKGEKQFLRKLIKKKEMIIKKEMK